MVEIIFPQTYNHQFATDVVTFPADIDGERMTRQITLEEMSRAFLCRVRPSTFEEEFLKWRPKIEERERRKILAEIAKRALRETATR